MLREMEQLTYRAPKYLVAAAKKKYGSDIFVAGATPRELRIFWIEIEKNAVEIGNPYEVGRTVVDIDAKSHINTGDRVEAMDSFKITSGASSQQVKTSSTSYQLQLAVQKETQVGANLNFRVGGPAFFNLASGGLTAGSSYKYSTVETETKTETHSHTQSLSQTYQIVEALEVPARTKVRALVKTFAVTYRADTEVLFSVDAKATLPVRYRTKFSRRYLGGFIEKTGKIKAEELFRGEDEFEVRDEILTFKRKGSISYLSEEVEVTKEEQSLE